MALALLTLGAMLIGAAVAVAGVAGWLAMMLGEKDDGE